jgi:hypothetical protein
VPTCKECKEKIKQVKITKEISETLVVKEAKKQMDRTGLGLVLDYGAYSSVGTKGTYIKI